jgi:hypothetical protein
MRNLHERRFTPLARGSTLLCNPIRWGVTLGVGRGEEGDSKVLTYRSRTNPAPLTRYNLLNFQGTTLYGVSVTDSTVQAVSDKTSATRSQVDDAV